MMDQHFQIRRGPLNSGKLRRGAGSSSLGQTESVWEQSLKSPTMIAVIGTEEDIQRFNDVFYSSASTQARFDTGLMRLTVFDKSPEAR